MWILKKTHYNMMLELIEQRKQLDELRNPTKSVMVTYNHGATKTYYNADTYSFPEQGWIRIAKFRGWLGGMPTSDSIALIRSDNVDAIETVFTTKTINKIELE